MVESSEKHKQHMKNYMNNRYKNDPEFRKNLIIQMREHSKNKNLRNKDKVYELLGGYKCICNGENCWHVGKCVVIDKRCLQLDHKNGGGCKQRKDLKRLGSSSYFYFLKDINIINDLQVLCANCNWVKRMNNKELPGRPKKY